MKILVIGSGGREHALCRTLHRTANAGRVELYCAPGSDGIAQDAQVVNLSVDDLAGLVAFAVNAGIDLTIVGSEAPLAAGLADAFANRGLAVVGPNAAAAQLEASKAFAKDFMARHHIPTARFRAADSADEARTILRGGEFGGPDAPVVVKADGLAAGKGVVVASTRVEAESAVAEMMEGKRTGVNAARRVVIEEALSGREASLLLWTDGCDYRLMPPARDHKRIGEGDTGPNTGGMGAVTAADVLDEGALAGVVRDIVEPTLEGLRRDRLDFRGVLFIGLMLTADGARVLEYNVRFGDPEAQAILVRLRSDLAQISAAVARRELGRVAVEWSNEASACVVLAARGYPEQPESGALIEGLAAAALVTGVNLFHAGTRCDEQGAWRTAGGRVLGVTATGATLEQALATSYAAAANIRWDGLQYRRDIGRARVA